MLSSNCLIEFSKYVISCSFLAISSFKAVISLATVFKLVCVSSILFFVLKLRLFSFIWILILDILVAIMIISFYKKNKVAGLLQIPYIIWIIFASYLNIAIYILNK